MAAETGLSNRSANLVNAGHDFARLDFNRNLQVNDLGQQKAWTIGPGLPLLALQGRV